MHYILIKALCYINWFLGFSINIVVNALEISK